MIYKIFVFGLIWLHFFCVSVHAQNTIVLPIKKVVIGANVATNAAIFAEQFILPEDISYYYVDTLAACIYGQFVPKSEKIGMQTIGIFKYNLQTQRLEWSTQYNTANFSIDQYENIFVVKQNYISQILNPANGEIMWYVNGWIDYINKNKNIAVGYANIKENSSFDRNEKIAIKAFELYSGKQLWARIIEAIPEENTLHDYNDSTIVCNINGLSTYHCNTGVGWNVDSKSMGRLGVPKEKNDVPIGVTIGVGLLTGLLTGVAVLPTGSTTTMVEFSNLHSNILKGANQNLYYASVAALIKVDNQGSILWSYPLNTKATAITKIYELDSAILIVNKGIINYKKHAYLNGHSYLIWVNKFTGKLVNKYNFINDYVESTMLDYLKVGNHLYVLTHHQLLHFDIVKAKLLHQKIIKNKNANWKLLQAPKTTLLANYFENYNLDADSLFILRQENNTRTVYKCNLELADKYASESALYYPNLLDNIYVFSNAKETIFANAQKNITAKTEPLYKLQLHGGFCYGVAKNYFYRIAKKQFD
jgi:hypothetical protein